MSDERELIAEREKKVEEIRALGANPYANGFSPTHTAAEIAAKFATQVAAFKPPAESADKKAPPELLSDEDFAVAGRIVALRGFGSMAFVKLLDRSGQIQIQIRKDLIGDAAFAIWKKLERGDFIGAVGSPAIMRTGELTIIAENVVVLTKATRPLPEKWHGLSDQEVRYRQRYVDLVVNPDVREVFRKRSAIVRGIRQFLDARGFLEVETPMMHSIVGGAAARPFTTHHNALDIPLYMRIAPELHLKRLVVGSFERVYEIGRNFRNEGLSRQHNPEFTMLEFYQAYATYEDLMRLTEALFQELAREIADGGEEISYQGQALSLASPWPRIPMKDAVVEAARRGAPPGGSRARRARRRRRAGPLDRSQRRGRPGRRAGRRLAQGREPRRARRGPLRSRGREGAARRSADLRDRVPGRDLTAVASQRRRSDAGRPLRAVHRRPRARQRLLRAERSGRSAGPLCPPGRRQGLRPRRDHGLRRGLLSRAGVRPAADGRGGDRHRSLDHAAHRPALDPRRDLVSAHAAGAVARSHAGPWVRMVRGLAPPARSGAPLAPDAAGRLGGAGGRRPLPGRGRAGAAPDGDPGPRAR